MRMTYSLLGSYLFYLSILLFDMCKCITFFCYVQIIYDKMSIKVEV